MNDVFTVLSLMGYEKSYHYNLDEDCNSWRIQLDAISKIYRTWTFREPSVVLVEYKLVKIGDGLKFTVLFFDNVDDLITKICEVA